jgi:hypothetical protein
MSAVEYDSLPFYFCEHSWHISQHLPRIIEILTEAEQNIWRLSLQLVAPCDSPCEVRLLHILLAILAIKRLDSAM